MFQDLSASPATMPASKAADCFGALPGHATEQADAVQAYTQAELKGTPTYVRLPYEVWPSHFHGIKDPVCPLYLALYGHVNSGAYWENHCDEPACRFPANPGMAKRILPRRPQALLDGVRG